MKEPLWKIGEYAFATQEGENVKIQDVHISSTSGQIIYECLTSGMKPTYPLYREEDMDDRVEEEY